MERNQSLIKLIIKRYARTVGSDLERYYVLKIIQKSLLTLDTITDLQPDVVYE